MCRTAAFSVALGKGGDTNRWIDDGRLARAGRRAGAKVFIVETSNSHGAEADGPSRHVQPFTRRTGFCTGSLSAVLYVVPATNGAAPPPACGPWRPRCQVSPPTARVPPLPEKSRERM